MRIDLRVHRYSATVGDWRGVFTNAGVASDTAKWNATHYDTGAPRVGWREWAVVDEEKMRFVVGGVGAHEDDHRMVG